MTLISTLTHWSVLSIGKTESNPASILQIPWMVNYYKKLILLIFQDGLCEHQKGSTKKCDKCLKSSSVATVGYMFTAFCVLWVVSHKNKGVGIFYPY